MTLKLTFPGANPHPRLEPFDRLETRVSYFLGNDPDKWRPDVPVWDGVRYVDLYPGIDLEISSEAGRWTWQLVPRSEAPSPFQGEGWGGGPRLRLEGAAGRVRATTALDELTLPPLLAGPTATPLAATVQGDIVAFSVAPPAAEPSQPSTLNLQPSTPTDNPDDLLYATLLGGSSDDRGFAIAVDGAGAAYVTGFTRSSDFPTTPGAFDTSFNGTGDTFVVKLAVGGGICPDFNNSGMVDVADIQAVASRWRQRSSDPGWDPRFALDGDGDIDMVDVMRVAVEWQRVCS